ncbi:hypothetical protein BW733_13730 [Tessaracoccus flavescens]|uniref:Uncharacterized protein n=1 Tax=Tessaracoccus flavescens TaxID=399497 RepID=A0A1Q2D006_9ACTN|nr:hypothetical protein BW733_13730 [Tessaracoccus flavescens]
MTLTQKTLGDVLKIGLTAEALGLATERPSVGRPRRCSASSIASSFDLGLTEEQKARFPRALTDALTAEGLIEREGSGAASPTCLRWGLTPLP